MSHFGRIVIAAVVALGMVATGLSIVSARLGPTVDTLRIAASLDGVSVNSTIGISFTEPMSHQSVERAFRLSPAVKGAFNWVGNELVYLPSRSLSYDTVYHLSVRGTAKDAQGRTLFRTYSTSFTTQTEHLLYLGATGTERGRLVLASVGGAKEIVGDSGGNVGDFSVSLDKTLAVYAKRGSPSERTDEIWMLSLSDGSSQRVYRRPDWQISQPHISPDGQTIAFLAENVRICQKYYKCFRDRSSPIVELLNLRSHKVRQFQSPSDQPITNFIDFSPAGQIAYTDLGSPLTTADVSGQHTTHIPSEGNELAYAGFDQAGDKASFVGQTPGSSGGDVLVFVHGHYIDVSKGVYDSTTPSFSTSGTAVAYAGYRTELGIEPIYGITTYAFASKKSMKLTSEKRFSDWAPQWSPDDKYIAFVRSQPQEAMYMGTGEVWGTRSDRREAFPLGGVASEVRWVI
jgi:Tol biopolymer transport system component